MTLCRNLVVIYECCTTRNLNAKPTGGFMKRRRMNSNTGRRKLMLKKIHNKVINRRKSYANIQMEETEV